MANPIRNNIRSKLDRAIVAYLKTKLPSGTNIYPANNSGTKALPNITVRSHRGRATIPFDGSWDFLVQIEAHYPAALQPGEANPDALRVAGDLLFDSAIDALMQTSNQVDLSETAAQISTAGRLLQSVGTAIEQANNADMLAFTCQIWANAELDGGNPAQDGGADTTRWAEIARFNATACPSNVD